MKIPLLWNGTILRSWKSTSVCQCLHTYQNHKSSNGQPNITITMNELSGAPFSCIIRWPFMTDKEAITWLNLLVDWPFKGPHLMHVCLGWWCRTFGHATPSPVLPSFYPGLNCFVSTDNLAVAQLKQMAVKSHTAKMPCVYFLPVDIATFWQLILREICRCRKQRSLPCWNVK